MTAVRGAVHGTDNCLFKSRGFLQLENSSYGIEPLESSARFEHIVYQMKGNSSTLAANYSRIWQTSHQLNKGHFREQVTGRALVVRDPSTPLPFFASCEGGTRQLMGGNNALHSSLLCTLT